jgi:hypothetical protein
MQECTVHNRCTSITTCNAYANAQRWLHTFTLQQTPQLMRTACIAVTEGLTIRQLPHMLLAQ